MFKRFLAIIMLMAVFTVTSCSSNEASLLSFLPADDEEHIDFEGYVFKLLGGVDPVDKKTDGGALTVYDDALISWNDHIEQTYNCVIEYEDMGPARYMPTREYTPKIVSGLADWSLMSFIGVDLINMLEGGFLTPWSDTSLDLTDLDKYFGSSEQYKLSSTFNGKTYGISCSNWSAHNTFAGMLISNNNLLKKYTDVSVHEMKENGKWTFDGFKKLLEDCTVNIGDSIEIMPVTCYTSRVLATASVFANGGHVVDYDETTNKYSYGLTSPKAVKGLEYAKSLYDAKLASHTVESGTNFWEKENAVFYLGHIEGLSESIKVLNDSDVISFPYGPDVEYGSVCPAYISREIGYMTCPITADAELTAKFVSLWLEPMTDLSKEDIVADFKNTMFYNDESVEEFFYMAENAQTKYYTHFGSAHEKLIDTLGSFVTTNETITAQLEKTRKIFEDQINRAFNDN